MNRTINVAMSFNEQSSVSMLKELCDRKKGILRHEFLPYELNASTFVCVANAFDMFAQGEGRTKRMAKHKACENLLCKYSGFVLFVCKLFAIENISKSQYKITFFVCFERTFQLNC